MTAVPGRHEPLVLSRHEDGVAWLTLNRPARLNAFAGTMRDDLAEAISAASAAPGTRVIVITGAGRAFCAGADVEVMEDLLAREDEETFRGFVEAGMRVVRQIRRAPQPVVAAVNGVAAGAGASLVAACDLRIASEGAAIGFTFGRIGLHPDWGATHFLPRLVGAGRAAELIYLARILEAGEALAIGLFQRVLPSGEFAEGSRTFARELAGKSPLALARAKETLGGADATLEAALHREAEAQLACFRGADAREGIAAFREKRAPEFRGA